MSCHLLKTPRESHCFPILQIRNLKLKHQLPQDCRARKMAELAVSPGSGPQGQAPALPETNLAPARRGAPGQGPRVDVQQSKAVSSPLGFERDGALRPLAGIFATGPGPAPCLAATPLPSRGGPLIPQPRGASVPADLPCCSSVRPEEAGGCPPLPQIFLEARGAGLPLPSSARGSLSGPSPSSHPRPDSPFHRPGAR